MMLVRSPSDCRTGPIAVFLAALILFSINLDRPPHQDEMHHALAAQHLIETGRPILDQGEYTRGIVYTWCVAASYELFGEGLASARAPSVLFMAAVAAILFAWVRREAGELAAWISAGLFVSSPFAVEIAQFCRFYSLQMLAFLLGAVCIYYSLRVDATPRKRVSLIVAGMALFALAVWMQPTTFMGLVGVAVWGCGVVVLRVLADTKKSWTDKAWLLGLLFAVGLVVLLAATSSGWLQSMVIRYRQTALFSVHTRDEFWFYHVRYMMLYPTLWSLTSIVAVGAMLKVPRFGCHAVVIFSISFLLTSFGGMKATRYLSFAQPFLFIIWGVGLASVAPLLSAAARTAREELRRWDALPQRLSKMIVAVVAVAVALILLLMNPFWLRSAAMIGNVALPMEVPNTDWRAARTSLEWWTANADIMITTEELGAIYFLGRSDVRYSASKLGEIANMGQGFEFGIDWRTGRPVISKPESLRQLIECFDRGLVVGPIQHWGDRLRISEEAKSVIQKYARPIAVPKESYLYAWAWDHGPREPRPTYCAGLGRFSGRKTH